MPQSSPTPQMYVDNRNDNDNDNDNKSIVERLQTRLRSKHHGMGSFADGLMRGVVVRSYCPPSASTSASASASASPSNQKHRLILSFPVTRDLCNSFDSLHGGAQATAVDVFTSVVLSVVHPVPSVTTDLHVSCLSPAPLGSTVLCVCEVERFGGRLQFASCDLYRVVDVDGTTNNDSDSDSENENENENENEARWIPVAKGLHTKYVVKHRAKGWAPGTGNQDQNHRRGGIGIKGAPVPRSKL